MIQEQFLPPQTLVSALPQSWQKEKRIALGLIFTRFCINNQGKDKMQSQGMSSEGLEFLFKALGIHRYRMHSFYACWVMGIPQNDVVFLQRDDYNIDNKTISMDTVQYLFRLATETGARELWPHPFTNADIATAADAVKNWLARQTTLLGLSKMFAQSWGPAILGKDGSIFMASVDDQDFSFMEIDMDDDELHSAIEISTKANCGGTCDSCGEPKACIKKLNNGQTVCLHCLPVVTGYETPNKMPDCSHIDCLLAGCPEYKTMPTKQVKYGGF